MLEEIKSKLSVNNSLVINGIKYNITPIISYNKLTCKYSYEIFGIIKGSASSKRKAYMLILLYLVKVRLANKTITNYKLK